MCGPFVKTLRREQLNQGPPIGRMGALLRARAAFAARMERHLTTLFGIVESADLKNFGVPAARRKRGWLPLLTVLFLISYGLMTMLIVEQGRTIESQRALIRELFGDSAQLSAMKLKASIEHAQTEQAQAASTQAPAAQAPSSQNPSTQIPSAQAPAKQDPSSQAVRRNQNRAAKPFRMPSRPASDLADSNRALITI